MAMKRKIIGFVVATSVLVGCGNSATETMYEHLEKAVELEEPFAEQQQLIHEAEENEYQLYEKIIALGVDEIEEVSELANQALESIAMREELIQTEKESLNESKEEFEQVDSVVSELDREELKELADRLKAEMTKRYASYEELYAEYIKAIEEDQTLFEMLKDETLTMEDLQGQIDRVNDQYEIVHEKKETFNSYTQTYNETKRTFYEEAELDVHYTE
ncbi:YkyA family protein [Bacillus sp. FJAT-45037]|uniref:YkyA family protein n=1 Tax=Bacillus sp. FJAT-45037 TaxID=2011007 RepID=UPI000C234DB6|nr:YkyA family protein [Bacillus sp. FJAT-45037]